MIIDRRLIATLVVIAATAACGGGSSSKVVPTATTVAVAPSPQGWPMLAHDERSSFASSDESAISAATAAQLHEAWQFKTAASVTGTPAIVDGRAYVLANGALYAFDVATGAVLWQNTAVKGTSSPTYADGKLYVNDGKAVLHRLDAATGTEEWQAKIDPHPLAGGFSSPVVAGGRVIVGSASTEEVVAKDSASFRGSLVAFDASTGAEIWRHYTVEPPFNGVSIWSTPSVDEALGLVYASTGNNYIGEASGTSDSIFAVDLATGALKWNRQLSTGDVFTIQAAKSPDSDFGTNPMLIDVTIDGAPRNLVAAGQKSGMFWALDRESGEIVWSRKASGGSALIGGVFNNGAFDGQRIIIAGNTGKSTGAGSEPSAKGSATSALMALNPANGDVLWERQLPAWVWAPITIANGVGFVSADSEIQAFDVATGAILYRLKTAGTIASGAAIADGHVIFGSGLAYLGTTNDNTLHALALP